MATKRPRSISPDDLPSGPSVPLERLYPSAGPALKPPKKKKSNPNDPNEPQDPPYEKRLKLYKRACPKATQERVDRVMSQRFFCIGRTRTSEITEEFKVLGSTGNVYTIRVGHVPTCDCPDGQKGNHCKHILFVFLKILQIPQSVNLWYQSALLTPELQAIFANARPAPQTQLEERVKKLYKIATGEAEPEPEGETEDTGLVKKRIPKEDDSCPICYEDFEPGSEQGLVFCLSPQGCGNPLHVPCFQNWARTATPVTCPLCREKWTDSNATAGGAVAGPSYSREGYLNLASSAGISTKRDTSTYYYGPRRGESYRSSGYGRDRYQDYGDDYDASDYWA
ncbi:RING finger protein [Sporobolomyces salmoneus]|uniref:RING finger protein n=1 Tax=Sporobolomyces salmoneus TaxID=183962 RepID=UPI003172348C